MMIGQVKQQQQRHGALYGLRQHTAAGLNMHHYGNVPGLLAFAAGGMELRFHLVKPNGQVNSEVVLLIRNFKSCIVQPAM
jgi:hypothetical protein